MIFKSFPCTIDKIIITKIHEIIQACQSMNKWWQLLYNDVVYQSESAGVNYWSAEKIKIVKQTQKQAKHFFMFM